MRKILFFGASGSLGHKFIERNSQDNYIYNFSRDEWKHWKMNIDFKNKIVNFSNIIGDIRDKSRVKETIRRINPNIVIMASALKHIEICEENSSESIKTNIVGNQNILDSIKELGDLINIESVCFISTDKACSPINTYGMCKAVSEKMVIEYAMRSSKIKYNIVRYGNVLNSRGSIIPLLHTIGKDPNYEKFTITDNRMTRFIMTLEESCKLIEYALKKGKNGEIIVPEIISMKIRDLFEIFSEKYKKEIIITGLRSGEKLYESLINGSQHICTYKNENYYHITPSYKNNITNDEQLDMNSNINLVSKEELKEFLIKENLL